MAALGQDEMLDIDDLREYVIGIWIGDEPSDNVANLDSFNFLGTAFFVTNKGDAITANHVLPDRPIEKGETLFGVMINGGVLKTYIMKVACRFEKSDFALLKFDIGNTKYFDISYVEPNLGSDVIAFGYPDHEIRGEGKELRVLKGYMTMPIINGVGELNFPVPSGMSGGPVIYNSKCIGFLMGNFTTEKILEQSEEVSEIYDRVEKITLIESKQIIHYGIFRPLSVFEGKASEIFGNRTLDQLIDSRNRS